MDKPSGAAACRPMAGGPGRAVRAPASRGAWRGAPSGQSAAREAAPSRRGGWEALASAAGPSPFAEKQLSTRRASGGASTSLCRDPLRLVRGGRVTCTGPRPGLLRPEAPSCGRPGGPQPSSPPSLRGEIVRVFGARGGSPALCTWPAPPISGCPAPARPGHAVGATCAPLRRARGWTWSPVPPATPAHALLAPRTPRQGARLRAQLAPNSERAGQGPSVPTRVSAGPGGGQRPEVAREGSG